MHAFERQRPAVPRRKSADRSQPHRTRLEQDFDAQAVFLLQRTLGNQAVQRLLNARRVVDGQMDAAASTSGRRDKQVDNERKAVVKADESQGEKKPELVPLAAKLKEGYRRETDEELLERSTPPPLVALFKGHLGGNWKDPSGLIPIASDFSCNSIVCGAFLVTGLVPSVILHQYSHPA